MGLEERLMDEMKDAMKSNDKPRLSIIRMIRSAIKNREIEVGKRLDDEGIMKVIQGMIRKGEEALEQFQNAGRTDLIEKEKKEIEILKSYLPQPLSQGEIFRMIDEAIQEAQASSLKDLGRVMKILMAKIGGKADGKLVNQWVKERLSP